ncbi:hatching enzyme 1.2-like [Hyla sarda]|uniref:hatching enzyme 1.2-like n=1 Tax=Hyla sarda TaxID=327740 RepID=UPI0024C4004E|nr:hatching enzyme 1.2-like [Hyla sarda]
MLGPGPGNYLIPEDPDPGDEDGGGDRWMKGWVYVVIGWSGLLVGIIYCRVSIVYTPAVTYKHKTMEMMRLALLLCLANQAMPRPVREPRDLPQDTNDLDLGPTVFEVIETANKDISVLLKEGDIAINLHHSARICKTCLWSKNKDGTVQVPYVIDPQYSPSDKSMINEALKEFEVMTCVQFVNRNSESDYLYIQSGSGCWSYIGKIFGKQTVSLESQSCMVYGVIQHEAMHNIGFFHEHSRTDRDDYVDILWDNIEPDGTSNFKIVDSNSLNLPYDYTSVMHYHMYAFSLKDDLPTIVPKPDPVAPIGQRSGMSNLDVMKINALYNCNLCRKKLMETSGSFSGNSSFTNQYGGNCLWLIQVLKRKILLQVDYLRISSPGYIRVYDGVTKSSRVLLEKTSGGGHLRPMVSSGHNMLVEFVTTASSKFSEFDVSYNTVT